MQAWVREQDAWQLELASHLPDAPRCKIITWSFSSARFANLKASTFQGFTYISAEREGLVWTKSLRWLGGELYLNAEANATSADGEVSVAVLTADGRERPGYGAADAVAFQGNSTNSVICRFTIVVFAAGQLSFSRFCCALRHKSAGFRWRVGRWPRWRL